MFLGIACHAYAEVTAVVGVGFGIKKDAPVHVAYLPYQGFGMGMAFCVGNEAVGAWHGVAAQGEHVLYAEEIEVDEQVFYVVFCLSATDNVGHHLDAVLLLYASTHACGAWATAHHVLLYQSVGTFHILHLLAVRGNVDKCGLEGHQRVDGIKDAVQSVALQRWQQFEGEACLAALLCLGYYFSNLHIYYISLK